VEDERALIISGEVETVHPIDPSKSLLENLRNIRGNWPIAFSIIESRFPSRISASEDIASCLRDLLKLVAEGEFEWAASATKVGAIPAWYSECLETDDDVSWPVTSSFLVNNKPWAFYDWAALPIDAAFEDFIP